MPRCFWFFDRHGPKKDRDHMIDALVSSHRAYIIRPDLVPSKNASDKNMQMFIESGRPWHIVNLQFDDYSQEPDKLVREIHTLGRLLLEGRFTSSKSTGRNEDSDDCSTLQPGSGRNEDSDDCSTLQPGSDFFFGEIRTWKARIL